MEPVVDATGPPMLLTTGFLGNLQQVFLVLEGQTTVVPSLLSGTDKAFKAHYLFNVAYSHITEHLWQFLQKVLFNIQDATTTLAGVYDFQAFHKNKICRAN
jgi:hypothetical protein